MWWWPRDLLGRMVGVVAILAIAGFLLPALLSLGAIPYRPFDQIELPNSLGSARFTAPDGRVFVVSEPFGRVQRYGPAGFERAFGIESHGGAIAAGMSRAGNLLIYSGRAGHVVITYDADGNEIGPRQDCEPGPAHCAPLTDRPSFQQNAAAPVIAQSWLAFVAVPLWHPFAAWIIGACAAGYLKTRSRGAAAAR